MAGFVGVGHVSSKKKKKIQEGKKNKNKNESLTLTFENQMCMPKPMHTTALRHKRKVAQTCG